MYIPISDPVSRAQNIPRSSVVRNLHPVWSTLSRPIEQHISGHLLQHVAVRVSVSSAIPKTKGFPGGT